MADFLRSIFGNTEPPFQDGQPAPPEELNEPSQQDSSVYEVGDVIDGYKICKLLGKGGFGMVYLAQKGNTDVFVALKTFRDEFLADEAARNAFKKEALLWVQLGEHPFIVAARGVSVGWGRLFVRMDYVSPDLEGRIHLGDYLRNGQPLPLERVVMWSIQFCLGMEHANAHGIRSHRDIKPANILISQDIVKIADFGLASAEIAWKESATYRDTLATGNHRRDLHLSILRTDNGVRCGTPGYMAPEVYRGEPADVRSDIFSFGLVLWQMAAGSLHPPFIGPYKGDMEEFLRENYKRQMAGRMPPIPGPLSTIIKRCLSSSPSERYSSFEELRSELEPLYQSFTGSVFSMPAQSELDISFWINKALAFGALGRPEEALASLTKPLEIDPFHLKSAALKVSFLYKLSRLQEALDCCDKVLARSPLEKWILLIKGEILERQMRYDEAVKCYDQILSISPHFSLAWTEKARAFFKSERINDALDCCDKAISINPRDIRNLREKYLYLRRLRKHDEALVCIDNIISLSPSSAEYLTFRAILLVDMNRPNEAAKCINQAINIDRLYIPAWRVKGDILYNSGFFADSIICYGRVLAIDPKDVYALNNMGRALLSLGKQEEADKCFDQLLAIDPKYWLAWHNKGIIQQNMGQYKEAIKYYDQALAINNQYFLTWANKGVCQNNIGQHNEAIKSCGQAITLDPSNEEPWHQKGFALSRLGRHDEAIACLDKVLALNSGNAQAWFEKGYALHCMKCYEESIFCYDRAVEVDPQNALAWGNKAIAEDAAGKTAAAISSFTRFLEVASLANAEQISYAQKRLRELNGK